MRESVRRQRARETPAEKEARYEYHRKYKLERLMMMNDKEKEDFTKMKTEGVRLGRKRGALIEKNDPILRVNRLRNETRQKPKALKERRKTETE